MSQNVGRVEHVTTRVEFSVPCDSKWGSSHNDVAAALTAAKSNYREITKSPETEMISDEAIRVGVVDGKLIVFFTVEDKRG